MLEVRYSGPHFDQDFSHPGDFDKKSKPQEVEQTVKPLTLWNYRSYTGTVLLETFACYLILLYLLVLPFEI